MTQTHIQDNSSLHRFRTEIPNILFDIGLSPYEFTFYCYLKRVAGDAGACWKSNKTIAEESGISERKIRELKQSLSIQRQELGGRALITVTKRVAKEGDRDSDWVTIEDVWDINMVSFVQKNIGAAGNAGGVRHDMPDGPARGADKEEHSKKNPIKKDNVSTLPSSMQKKKASPDRYINSLNPEQKKLHDSLIKHRPDWGQPLKSEDVCAWFLAKKYTIQQVTDAFLVYRQDAAEAKSKGRVLRDMGAYVVGAIKNKRIPKNPSFEANKQMAISSLAKQENMKAMDKYVSYQLGAHEDQIPYSLPMSQFTTMLEETKRKINNQQECYA